MSIQDSTRRAKEVLPPPPPSFEKQPEVKKEEPSSKKAANSQKSNAVKKDAGNKPGIATKKAVSSTAQKDQSNKPGTNPVKKAGTASAQTTPSQKKDAGTDKKSTVTPPQKKEQGITKKAAVQQPELSHKQNKPEENKTNLPVKHDAVITNNTAAHKPETKKTDSTLHKREKTNSSEIVEKMPVTTTSDSIVLKPFPVLKKKVAKTDSVAIAPKSAETKAYTPFYNNHLLKVTHTNPLQLNTQSYDWIFYVLLFVIGAFTVVKTVHRKSLTQIKEAFLSNTISNQIVRDENILFQRASVFLTVIFYLTSSLFLFKISNIFQWNSEYISSGFSRFLIFILLISLVYSLKFIILRFIGFIFQTDKPVSNYVFNLFLINNVLGIILIPLLIGTYFLPAHYATLTLDLSIIAVISSFIYRIIRGVMIGSSYPNFSLYYLFLYICTLEIAPMLLLLKMLI